MISPGWKNFRFDVEAPGLEARLSVNRERSEVNCSLALYAFL
jgi:hypothetical protein